MLHLSISETDLDNLNHGKRLTCGIDNDFENVVVGQDNQISGFINLEDGNLQVGFRVGVDALHSFLPDFQFNNSDVKTEPESLKEPGYCIETDKVTYFIPQYYLRGGDAVLLERPATREDIEKLFYQARYKFLHNGLVEMTWEDINGWFCCTQRFAEAVFSLPFIVDKTDLVNTRDMFFTIACHDKFDENYLTFILERDNVTKIMTPMGNFIQTDVDTVCSLPYNDSTSVYQFLEMLEG